MKDVFFKAGNWHYQLLVDMSNKEYNKELKKEREQLNLENHGNIYHKIRLP